MAETPFVRSSNHSTSRTIKLSNNFSLAAFACSSPNHNQQAKKAPLSSQLAQANRVRYTMAFVTSCMNISGLNAPLPNPAKAPKTLPSSIDMPGITSPLMIDSRRATARTRKCRLFVNAKIDRHETLNVGLLCARKLSVHDSSDCGVAIVKESGSGLVFLDKSDRRISSMAGAAAVDDGVCGVDERGAGNKAYRKGPNKTGTSFQTSYCTLLCTLITKGPKPVASQTAHLSHVLILFSNCGVNPAFLTKVQRTIRNCAVKCRQRGDYELLATYALT
jgi:hypothetical protein